VVLSSKLYREVGAISFHPYFSRVCSLHFTLANINIRAISCYFPTAWNTNEAVGGAYELLNVLLESCVRDGTIPLLGGDFNVCIGRCRVMLTISMSLVSAVTGGGTAVESLGAFSFEA
jgi:hypothetical protein